MKRMDLKSGFVWALALFACVAGAQGRTVREALDALLRTEYCGTAGLDGIGLSTAIHGETPLAGGGLFKVQEEEWRPVLIEIANDELDAYKRYVADRAAKNQDGVPEATFDVVGYGQFTESEVRSRALCGRLRAIAMVSLFAEGGTEQLLDMLERIALEAPEESFGNYHVSNAFVKKASQIGQFSRCLELGRKCRAVHGPGGDDTMEWYLFRHFVDIALPLVDTDAERAKCFRYILGFSETLTNLFLSREFDEWAADSMPGWVGSIQRRRLAARFPDESIPRRTGYDFNTHQTVDLGIDETTLPRMLKNRAAAELAADESELTDLREVYGDWAKEDARD